MQPHPAGAFPAIRRRLLARRLRPPRSLLSKVVSVLAVRARKSPSNCNISLLKSCSCPWIVSAAIDRFTLPPLLPLSLRAQNLLRSQLAIEYIVKLVEFVWVRYFKELEHKG